MTTVAAANAEPTALNRARQTVADPAPTEDSSSDGSQAFAAVLTSTRQTTMMLRRLLGQRVDQISSSHQRQRQAAEAVTPSEDREVTSQAEDRRSSRADRSISSSDRSKTARHASSSSDEVPAKTDASEPSTDYARSEDPQAIASENPAPAVAAVPEQQGSDAGGTGSSNPQYGLSGGGQSSIQQASKGSPEGTEPGTSSAVAGRGAQVPGGGVSAQAPVNNQPGAASTATQQTAAVSGGASILAPVASTSQMSGGNGTAPELGQGGAAAKAGQVTAKSGTAPAEFQPLLQQAGRGRSAVAAGEGGSAKAGTGAEETVLDPSRAESIEKLARVLRSQIGARNSTMTLRLDPPELGNLRVEVRMQDQTLTLKFQADTQAGHNALQSRLDSLRQTLEQQGVRVEQISVEYRPQATDSTQQSRDWSNPSSYDGSQSGYGGGFGQAQEQGRGMQESYASAGYARWSDASPDIGGSSEVLTVGAGSVSASGVDLIA